ncbi:VTT domain-containing protein [Actinomycetospora sp. OC33-EN08]|uniref:VTT domain-containing protein n=1 Tax=Actinomycetospora aurantiaca TaxID=3129233 RepID=A0ABU8MJW1_9PSEU
MSERDETPTAQEPEQPQPEPAAPPRSRWRRQYSPEEIEAAKQQWRDMRPWDSPMARADKVLIGCMVGAFVLAMTTLPLRPFLLASHPTALAAVTGSSSAVGAGAAFARIGQADLWLVIVAGIVGKIKFDWLYWWAGRRWGAKGVRFFVPSDRAARFVERVRAWPMWAMFLVVVVAALPGIPSVLAYLLAGLAGLSLGAFLVASVVGAGIMTGLVAGLGYALGQSAVDVVLLIDRYALWISLSIAVFIAISAGRAQSKRQKQQAAVAATPES